MGGASQSSRVWQTFESAKRFLPLIREASSVLTRQNTHTHTSDMQCFIILKIWPSILFTIMMCWGKLRWSYFKTNVRMFSSIHVVSEIWRWILNCAGQPLLQRIAKLEMMLPGVFSLHLSTPHLCWELFQPRGSGFWWHPACSGAACVCRKAGTGAATWAGFLPTFRPSRAQGRALSSPSPHGLTCSGPQCWCGLWMPLILLLPASSILSCNQKKSCAVAKPFFSTHWVMRALLKM